jgi:hypothetical protein
MDAWLNALSVSSRRITKECEATTAEDRGDVSPITEEESVDHLSDVSGAGGVGGAGGALGNTTSNLAHLHVRASERLGRA